MYAQQDIEIILKPLAELLKVHDVKKRGYGKKPTWDDVPDYWPGYKEAVKYMNQIRVHSELCDFPEELFAVRAPNQTEKEADYIKANYKQCTLPVFMDYISTMTRPFFDGNWSIDYQKHKWEGFKGDTIQEYVESEITAVGDLETYMKQVVAQVKAVDANGSIAIRPKEIAVTAVYDSNGEPTGAVEVDNSKLFEPVPIYFSVDKKLSFKQGKYYLFLSDAKSLVDYNGKKVNMGNVFEFYDDENIWMIEQTGKYIDFTFNYRIYYKHEWGKVPVVELKGIPQIIDTNKMIWISPFHYAVPNLNNALVSTQYMNASKDRTMFPYLVMLGRPCSFDYKNTDGTISTCDRGRVFDNERNSYIECPSCRGTGQQDRVSPFGVMLLNPESEFNKGDNAFGGQAMYYVSPDTRALEFVRECIQNDIADAKAILHQQTSNSRVQGTENLTATGMGLDSKAMYAFVKTPSDQMFDIWEFIIDAIGWQRYGKAYIEVILIRPVSFDYNTDEDYLNQISEAQKAGLPPFVIHSIIFKYLQTLYYSEQERASVFSLIINTDRLVTLSQDDITLKVSKNLCEPWEVVLHDSAINFVSDLIVEDNAFFEKPFVDQQQALIEKAKENTPGTQSAAQAITASFQ